MFRFHNLSVPGMHTKASLIRASKRATFFVTLLQNELNSDVARFTTHVQTCQQPDLLQDRFDVGGETLNMAIQLV